MKLRMIGCNHHTATVEFRERLAFSRDQICDALKHFRERFPSSEAVLLSTCNRVELYTASDDTEATPSSAQVKEFLAACHGLDVTDIESGLLHIVDEDAVRHLFSVAASLDSMVVGEVQILAQVKEAYQLAQDRSAIGPLTHSFFQTAIRVAKRVATETSIHERRVSIPSVAVHDFVDQFFDRLDDKKVLVIGAGEMGTDTVRYLMETGAHDIVVVNRNRGRAEELARQYQGRVVDWSQLKQCLIEADLVVSTTGAKEPVIQGKFFREVSRRRHQRPLFVLDLAVPRDFAPEIGEVPGVYLYSLDDLQKVCAENQVARKQELHQADQIIDEESLSFMSELHHRATAPTIRRLREQADAIKQGELKRLNQKLQAVDAKDREEISRAFDRLINKLLHPPLESLRDEAQQGQALGLLEALKRLFQLRD